jgi:hypothetical protein
MDDDIREYNERLTERLKLKDKGSKEDRDDFLLDNKKVQVNVIQKTKPSPASLVLEQVKNEIRIKGVNPAALYSLYNRNNFPKKKLLYDSDGTSYYPLDGLDLYAFKMKKGRMTLPYGETILYKSKKDYSRAYINRAVLGICEGNKSIVKEYEDAKPSIICGTVDIFFL